MVEKYGNINTTVYYGDCLNILKLIPNKSISLIFADPPYNIGKKFGNFNDSWPSEHEYIEWCYSWLSQCIEKLTDNGSLYLMASTQAMPYLDIWLRDKLTILSRIVWHYDSSGVQAKKYFGSLYEPILFCVVNKQNYIFNSKDIEIEAKTGAIRKLIDYRKNNPTVYNSKKVPGNTWYFPRVRYRMEEYKNHPSQKPMLLLERIIKASSNEGDVVLDPFSGTFTTSAVAQKLGRKSIGIELQKEYVDIGLQRLGLSDYILATDNKPKKNTKIKNKNGIKYDSTKDQQLELYDANL